MAIDSISLLAQNTYAQIQNRPKIAISEEVQIQKAASFQNLVQKQFNSFASMSPDQILNHIKKAQTTASFNAGNSGIASGVVRDTIGTLRSSLNKQETLVRKSLINEASLVDVLTATTEASNTMKTVVEVRNKFMDAFDKVMNMTM